MKPAVTALRFRPATGGDVHNLVAFCTSDGQVVHWHATRCEPAGPGAPSVNIKHSLPAPCPCCAPRSALTPTWFLAPHTIPLAPRPASHRSRPSEPSPHRTCRRLPRSGNIVGKKIQEDMNNTFALEYRPDGARFVTAGLDRKARARMPHAASGVVRLISQRLPRQAQLSPDASSRAMRIHGCGVYREASPPLRDVSVPLSPPLFPRKAQVRLYDAATQKLVCALSADSSTVGHTDRVFSLKYTSRDDDLFVSGGWDDTVYVWDGRCGRAVRSFFGPHVCGDSLDFDPGTGRVMSGSWREREALQLWDLGKGELVETLPWRPARGQPPCFIYAAMYGTGPMSRFIVAGGSKANEMRVVDKETGRPVARFADLPTAVNGVDVVQGDAAAVIGVVCEDSAYLLSMPTV